MSSKRAVPDDSAASPPKRARGGGVDNGAGGGFSPPADGPSFALGDFDALGFDLDHTLARYKLGAVSRLIFDGLVRFLVEHSPERYGGDGGISGAVYELRHGGRGLVFDRVRGNLLKLCAGRLVHLAFHGSRRLAEEEVARLYPGPVSLDNACQTSEEYWPLLSFFEMPAAQLMPMLVEHLDARFKPADDAARAALYRQLFEDLLCGFDHNFSEFGRGYYFPCFAEPDDDLEHHIGRYVRRRPELRAWLESVRDSGVRVFMVTNSRLDYATVLLNYIFGDDWRDLFCLSVVNGGKGRGFFRDPKRPLHRTDAETGADAPAELDPGAELEEGGVYAQGNYSLVHAHIRRLVGGGREPRIAYFGDHLGSDVHATDTYTPWVPCGVIEEAEQFGTGAGAGAMRDSDVTGSFFYCGGKDSFWFDHLKKHAALIVPDVAALAGSPIDRRYTCRRGTAACFGAWQPEKS